MTAFKGFKSNMRIRHSQTFRFISPRDRPWIQSLVQIVYRAHRPHRTSPPIQARQLADAIHRFDSRAVSA
jgi:hypothetical protein